MQVLGRVRGERFDFIVAERHIWRVLALWFLCLVPRQTSRFFSMLHALELDDWLPWASEVLSDGDLHPQLSTEIHKVLRLLDAVSDELFNSNVLTDTVHRAALAILTTHCGVESLVPPKTVPPKTENNPTIQLMLKQQSSKRLLQQQTTTTTPSDSAEHAADDDDDKDKDFLINGLAGAANDTAVLRDSVRAFYIQQDRAHELDAADRLAATFADRPLDMWRALTAMHGDYAVESFLGLRDRSDLRFSLVFARVVETSVEASDDRECFGKPQATCEYVGTIDRPNRVLETKPSYESRTKHTSRTCRRGQVLSRPARSRLRPGRASASDWSVLMNPK